MCGRYYVDDETAKEIEKLVFARLKSACIKGFRARSAGGWYVYMSCALFVPQMLTCGEVHFGTFCPKGTRPIVSLNKKNLCKGTLTKPPYPTIMKL